MMNFSLLAGNLAMWWEFETFRKFLDKTSCIIYQYGNYTAESINLKLNGINTQGENIADNGGIKEAYRAYGKLVINNILFDKTFSILIMQIVFFRTVYYKTWKREDLARIESKSKAIILAERCQYLVFEISAQKFRKEN